MFEKFTDRARRVVVLSQEEARLLNHNYIGTEHLLLGLLSEPEGIAGRALRELGLSLEATRDDVIATVGRGTTKPQANIPFTPRAKKVLELSLREALHLNHSYIDTEHILLGLLREREGMAATVLVQRGATLEAARTKVLELLTGVPQATMRGLRQLTVQGLLQGPDVLATPAAQRALEEVSRLSGGKPISTHHLLLALLTDPDNAAAKALAIAGAELDRIRAEVAKMTVEGTADELPQEAGARGMTLSLTADAMLLEVTDPHLLAQARETFALLGDNPERVSLAGDDPKAASLAEVWIALAASLADIRSQLGKPEGPQVIT